MSYLVDTHCHIHDAQFDLGQVYSACKEQGVGQLLCIGTSGQDSERAVSFVADKPGMWAAIGLHPHDARLGEDDLEIIARLAVHPKVVAIGECGLDFYYNNSPKSDQIRTLEYQLQLAQSFGLPCVFHVRDAFVDFWPILDNFPGMRGVIHSFTGTPAELGEALARNLLIGVNGIATFTKDEQQKAAYSQIPLESLLLETDSPFLTPSPLRGTMNVPANVRLVAAYLAEMRDVSLDTLIEATTSNAHSLFKLGNEQLN